MQSFLKKLHVTNFRNIQSQVFEFNQNINCIFGNNGNGKTNLLEIIYFIINKKSFRKKTTYQQIISIEAEKPEIIFNSLLIEKDDELTHTGKVTDKDQSWYLNNKPQKKINLQTIFINPYDSIMFHSIPQFRREWIDQKLGKLDSNYKKSLTDHAKIIKFKNKLLAEDKVDYLQLKVLNKNLSVLILDLTVLKLKFLENIVKYCPQIFKQIFNEEHNLVLELESKFIGKNQIEIEEKLNDSLHKECRARKCLYGVHRDDYIFYFDNFNSFEYCSLGQQKMSYLSLIFAYIELFRYKYGVYPIVLIDDVSGELDSVRWKNLIGYLKEKLFQVFITTANESFKKQLENIDGSKKIYLEDGCEISKGSLD